jgi:NAD dependent epimerase/dehydratase
MQWMNRTVLVTGAGGFIGSHLTETLVQKGANVRAFVRYTSRHDLGLLSLLPADILKSVEVISGDLRDSEAIRNAMRGVETVFHLGALIAIPYSYRNPREVIETNVMGTLNILMAARESNISRVVHTSTSEVYGTAQYVPIDEQHPLQGQSPYSASKIGADKLAESFYRSFKVPVATVRPFNTYGPRQSARAVIPTIITQALALDQIRLGTLETLRDFTFVEDTVDGFLHMGFCEGVEGQVVNLGSEDCISIGDLARKILTLTGRDLPILSEDKRLRPPQSEVGRLHSNAQKAHNLLGWKPHTSLDEGLKKTIDWIQKHLDIYRPGRYEI